MAWRAAPSHEPRAGGRAPDILLMHYTGMVSAQAAIDRLCDPVSKVSCHYLVDERGRITRMVEEDRRAFHAGVSHWAGETDINSASIGIEIANPGHEHGYVDFPEAQMAAVEALSLDILSRHDIPPHRVLGHSDVAPARKTDPGERFDWGRLAAKGIGHWVPPAPQTGGGFLQQGDAGDGVAALQMLLATYGYGIEATGTFDEATTIVVTAFQRHFRPGRVDGIADRSTVETLQALLKALPELPVS